VSIIIEPVEDIATMGRKSQACMVVGALAEGGGGPIEQPNLAERMLGALRRWAASISSLHREKLPTSRLRLATNRPSIPVIA
jgi:hypothetical protein